MLKINLNGRVKKFLRKLPAKHERQVLAKVVSLAERPAQHDVQKLSGYDAMWRADVGEYRIIFYIDLEWIHVPLVGKRNDSEVYKKLKHLLG